MNFNNIINPLTNEKVSIYSAKGKQLLKNYIIMYKKGGDWNTTKQKLREYKDLAKSKIINKFQTSIKPYLLNKLLPLIQIYVKNIIRTIMNNYIDDDKLDEGEVNNLRQYWSNVNIKDIVAKETKDMANKVINDVLSTKKPNTNIYGGDWEATKQKLREYKDLAKNKIINKFHTSIKPYLLNKLLPLIQEQIMNIIKEILNNFINDSDVSPTEVIDKKSKQMTKDIVNNVLTNVVN